MVLTGAMSLAAAGQVTGSAESDTSRVRNKLRKFLQRRPTLQSLREKGYIKGACERGWIMGCWDGAGSGGCCHGVGSKIHAGMRVNPGWVLRWGVGIGPIKDGCWNGPESLGMSPGWRVGGDTWEWSWDSQ